MFETGLPTYGSSAGWLWDSPYFPWTFSTIFSDCGVANIDVEPSLRELPMHLLVDLIGGVLLLPNKFSGILVLKNIPLLSLGQTMS
jgi:hypothetical protein